MIDQQYALAVKKPFFGAAEAAPFQDCCFFRLSAEIG